MKDGRDRLLDSRALAMIRDQAGDPVDANGVEITVARIVENARRRAETIPARYRWAMLSMLAEIHKRVAAEIGKLAQVAAGEGNGDD
jgi:hypothetical protein